MQKQHDRKSNRKQWTLRKKLMTASACTLSVFLVLTSVVVIYACNLWGQIYEPLPDIPVINSGVDLTTSEDTTSYVPGSVSSLPAASTIDPVSLFDQVDSHVINVLLVGVDEEGKSDTLILASLDQEHKKLRLVSFLRDTWVQIPGMEESHRISAAYTAGDVKLAVQTLEANFGIPIDRYAKVDYQNFSRIIDMMGGLELTLSREEAEYINEKVMEGPRLDGAGTYNLTGDQALCHAQNRQEGAFDIERTKRQRDVIMAAIHQVKSTTDVVQISQMLLKAVEMVSTDISLEDLTHLAVNAMDYLNYDVEQFRIPSDGNYESATIEREGVYMNVLTVRDIEQTRESLKRFIYGEDGENNLSNQP